MIFGIGTDIISVARVRQVLDRHGERFAARLLAESEWDGYLHAASRPHFLAKRFAAKEAAAKALGTGFTLGLALRHIAVAHDGAGRPLLVFVGRGRELAESLGVGESFLSLSDEREHALAFVTLLKRVG